MFSVHPQADTFALTVDVDGPGPAHSGTRAPAARLLGLRLQAEASADAAPATEEPAVGHAVTRGPIRMVTLPDVAGRTGSWVVGVGGRTLLWAPNQSQDCSWAPDVVQALSSAELDGVALAWDRVSAPSRIATLRRIGALAEHSDVVLLTDRITAGRAQLAQQWGARLVTKGSLGEGDQAQSAGAARRTLLLGPASSGKSALAEEFLAATSEVEYLATGPAPDDSDPEWRSRVDRHRARRPEHWHTVECGQSPTVHIVERLRAPGPAILLDSLGTWTSAVLDEVGAWHEQPADRSTDEDTWRAEWRRQLQALHAAWRASPRRVVAVAEETGWGVVPSSRSGRIFRDCLGEATRALAQDSDLCLLVVAGRTVPLEDLG